MSPASFDTIILGGGAVGSAAAWQLAGRASRVLVVDRFRPPHVWGSTHGETRVIREAYFEHPSYVPLVQRAYELWRELELQVGAKLLQSTGGLMIGPPGGVVFQGARTSAELHQLPHEILDAAAVTRKFPALRLPDAFKAVLEPRAGLLFVEACVDALLKTAAGHGAVLRFDEPVLSWRANGAGVEVITARGRYMGSRLVIAAGAWLAPFVPELAPYLRVERQVLHWFGAGPDAAWCRPDRLPVHLVEYEPGRYLYTLPDVGSGVKTALHHQGETATAGDVRREVCADEQEQMAGRVRRFLPQLAPSPHKSTTCLYTNTPDEHFLLDRHPDYPNVFIASPCSGHGFKFASVVGELIADWATGRAHSIDLSLFKWGRFGCQAAT